MKKNKSILSLILSIAILASCFSTLGISAATADETEAITALKAAWADLTENKTELLAIPVAAQRKETATATDLTDEEKAAFGDYYYYNADGVQYNYTYPAGQSGFKDYSSKSNVRYYFNAKITNKSANFNVNICYGASWSWQGLWSYCDQNVFKKFTYDASNVGGADIRKINAIQIQNPNKAELYLGCIYVSYDEPVDIPANYEFFTAEDWLNTVYSTDFTGYNVTDEFKAAFKALENCTVEGKKLSALKEAYGSLKNTTTELFAIPQEGQRKETATATDLTDEEKAVFGEYYYYNDDGADHSYTCPVGQSGYKDYSGLSNVKYSFYAKIADKSANFCVNMSGDGNSWGSLWPYYNQNTLKRVETSADSISGLDLRKVVYIQIKNPNMAKMYLGCIYASYDEMIATPLNYELFSAEKLINAIYNTNLSDYDLSEEFKNAYNNLLDSIVFLRGDVSQDGKLDARDLAVLKRCLLKVDETCHGDINGDGVVNILDLVKLKKMICNIFGTEKTVESDNKLMKLSFVTDTLKVNEKIEIKADIDKSVFTSDLNYYDESDVDLSISLTSFNGTNIVVPGFYYEEYNFSSDGAVTGKADSEGDFRFRISLPEVSAWKFAVTLKIKGETVDTVSGYINTEENNDADNHGYLSVEPTTKKNFVFTDGTGFSAIGENIAWASDAVSTSSSRGAKMIEWMEASAENGANFTRIWLMQWFFSLQKTNLAPDDLSGGMSDAAQLDKIFEAWNEMGMYGQVCLFTFNQLKNVQDSHDSAWYAFPYNDDTANGYLENPIDFFTDEQAIKDTKTYLRYLIARYSYSTNLLAWEFFNEVDGVEGSTENADAVIEWHRIMTDYIRSIDPYNHMITTSTACRPVSLDINDTELKSRINADSIFDFASIHYYNYEKIEDLAIYQQNFQKLYSRPVMFGECGITSVGLDEDLVTFHQQNWIGVMGGGAGAAASWYWEKLDELNGYHDFKSLRDFADRIPLNSTSMLTVSTSDINLNNTKVKAWGYREDDCAYLWLYDTDFTQYNKSASAIENLTLSVALNNGIYKVEWINTWTGEIISQSTATAHNGVLELSAPAWCKDVAVSVTAE